MKIRKSSWHCKISNWDRYHSHNDNLCSYFWRLVLRVVLSIVMITCLVGVGGFFIYFLFTDPEFAILFTTLISMCVFPILAIHWLRKVLGKSPEIPGSNILFEYLKARKEKVCPIIEYVN